MHRSALLRLALLVGLGLLAACSDSTSSASDTGGDTTADADTGTNEDGTADNDTPGDGGPNLINGIVLPDPAAATFVTGVDNPYFPLPVAATWVYEADTEDGLERIDVEVLAETRDIMGVTATVVRDTVTVDDEIVEDTHDWYAQDSDGNVWYLGEDTCEYEDGECVSTVGAWEWGVDGALPGILMPGDPTVDGQPYYQEYFVGEAEDVGEVVAVDQSATVEAGSFTDCVRTHDTSTLDVDLDEFKVYCRGIGTVMVEEPDATEELTEYSGLE